MDIEKEAALCVSLSNHIRWAIGSWAVEHELYDPRFLISASALAAGFFEIFLDICKSQPDPEGAYLHMMALGREYLEAAKQNGTIVPQ